MKIRIIDEAGNTWDLEVSVVPRIGERILLGHGSNGEPAKTHFFRVHEVVHNLSLPSEFQVSILVAEEDESKLLPQ